MFESFFEFDLCRPECIVLIKCEASITRPEKSRTDYVFLSQFSAAHVVGMKWKAQRRFNGLTVQNPGGPVVVYSALVGTRFLNVKILLSDY